MHLDPTTHEHAASAKVYVYEADYEVREREIAWQAQVVCGDAAAQALRGSIPLSSPGVAAVAEEAVRDAIVKQIDTLGDAALP